MRLQAVGVLALVLTGLGLPLLAAAGAVPAVPPAAVAALLALAGAFKAATAAAGLLSYATASWSGRSGDAI
jgi:hypothetical protein